MNKQKWWKKEENLEKNGLLKLSTNQIKQLIERGYSWAIVDNKKIKITKDDLVFLKDEIDDYLIEKDRLKHIEKEKE